MKSFCVKLLIVSSVFFGATIPAFAQPPAPVATAATAVGETGFTANWGSSTGATGYFLDVATDAGFTSFVSGYNDKSVGNVLTDAVTGLTGGATYYYRVRATDGSLTSGNSNDITVVTLPAAPTATAATAITTTGFTSNWGSVTGATSYKLDVSTDIAFGSFLGSYNNLDVVGTSQGVTGLSPGLTYYYRVRAANGSGSGANSGTITTVTIPSAPTAAAATSITTTGFTANWGSVTGATGYKLDVSTDIGFGSFVGAYNNFDVAGTSQSVSGLSPGLTYYYRVRAANASGSGANSGTITAVTLPAAPTATAATSVTTTSFTANWGSVTGATSYRLDVSTDIAFGSFLGSYNNLTVAGTSQSVTGLAAGTPYYYRVRAVDAGGPSANSNTITATTLPNAPGTPTATAATSISTTGFTANWGSVSGATGYLLDVSSDAGFSSYIGSYHDLAVAGTSQGVTGLTAGSTYYYRVRAENAGGPSGYSNVITAVTLTLAPTATAATSVTASGFTANWGLVLGATSYRLDVATDAGFASFVSGYNDRSVGLVATYPVSGLDSGQTYYYRVRAVDAGGPSASSNTIAQLTLPGAPTVSPATSIGETSFTANWGSVTSATGYRLDVSISATFTSFVSGFSNRAVAGTSQSVTGLTGGTTYYYRVRAENATGTGANSVNGSALTLPAAPTAGAATSITTTGFTANWSAVTGAASYKLDVSTDIAFGSFVGSYNNLDVAGTSQAVTGLSAGVTYYYRVRGANGSGSGANSGTITVATIPGAPTATAATAITTTGFTANWGSVTGATSYKLDVSTDIAFGSFVGSYNNLNVVGTSQAVTGLSSGVTYYYRVRAANGSGSGANSGTITAVTIPAAPTATAATSITGSGFSANWGAATGATSYRLDVATDNGFTAFVTGYNDLAVGNVVTYGVSGLATGTTYYYRVRAVDAGGTSANSNTITATTLPDAPGVPVATAATSITTTGFTSNWGSVTGATGYRLDVATDGGFSAFVSGYNNLAVATTSQAVSGLSAGTTYYYRVRSENPGGASGNSNVITAVTLPVAPVATAATNLSSTSFSANWGSSAGATTYYLDVATDAGFTSFVGSWNNANVGNVLTASITGLTAGTSYYYRVRAADAGGASANSNTISTSTYGILTITTASPLPNGTAGTAYSQTLAASGGLAPYTWSIASGALPGGYSLIGSSGLISGTSTVAATANFTIKVKSANADSTTKAFTLTVTSAGATKLAFVQQPTNAAASATITPAVTVAIQDTYGNTVTTDATQITVAIGTNPSAGTLNGTLSVAPVSGVASFSTLSIDKSGNGYTLTASGGSLTGATSSSFNIASGSASRLNFGVQPTNASAGTAISPAVTVRIEDINGNLVSTATNAVTLTLLSNPGGATLTGGGPVSAVGGIATFSGISLDKSGTGYTLSAASGALTVATSSAFNISAGSPHHLTIRTAPSSIDTAGRVFSVQPVVEVDDINGNVVTTDATAIIASRSAGTGALQGTLSVNAVNGVATFTNLSYNVAETITIAFARTGLSTVTSGSLTIRAGDAAQLVFVTNPPTSVTAGATISPAVTVQVKDGYGNNVTTASTTTLALAGTGVLSGTLSQPVNGTGLATFNNLSVNLTGAKSLVATSSLGVTADTSSAFTVVPAAANHLTISTQPSPTAAAGVAFTQQPIVRIEDIFGNLRTADATAVLAAKGKGAGNLTGTTSVNALGGIATFTNLAYSGADTTNLAFSSAGVTGATSTDIVMSAGPLSTFLVESAAGGIIPAQVAGTPFSIRITAKDALGNTVTGFTGSVTITSTGTLTQGAGSTAAFTAGVLSSHTVTLSKTGTFTITATSGSSGTSNSFAVSAGALAHFLVEASAGGTIPTQTAGSNFAIKITAQDLNLNTVTTFTGPVTITAPGGKLFNAPVTSGAFASGVLSSQTVRLDSAGAGKYLAATYTAITDTSVHFTVNPGAASQIRVENLANGTGVLMAKQNVSSGQSIVVYAIRRDALNNFVDNTAADSWSLQVVSGGVVAGDLVAAADRKSATLTGHVVGQGIIRVVKAGLTSVNSDTLTVVNAGIASKIQIESAPNGTGTLIPAQSLPSGRSITMYTISRDASNNFVSNTWADWNIIGGSGNVVTSDLVVAPGNKSAIFTGKFTGTALIRADSGSIVGTPAGLITVIPGTAASITALGSTTPQSAAVNTTFPNLLGVVVKDSAGNSAPGVTVNFSAPSSGPSGSFIGGQTGISDSLGYGRANPFKANTIAGSYVDTAKVQGVSAPVLFFLTNAGGVAASIAADSLAKTQSAQIGTIYAIPFTVTVKDSFGNPVQGVSVTFTSQTGIGGASGTFAGGSASSQATTNASGIATAGAFSGNLVAGSFTLTATASGVTGSAIFNLTNLPGNVGGISVVSGSGQAKEVKSTFDSVLVVIVKDQLQNPVPNVLIQFIAPASGIRGLFGGTRVIDSVYTNSLGVARSSPLVADSLAGQFTVSATAFGLGTPAVFSLTVLGGAVAKFGVEAENGAPIGQQQAQIPFQIRITARDKYSNTVTTFADSVDVTSTGTLTIGGTRAGGFVQGVIGSYTVGLLSSGSATITVTRKGGVESGTSNLITVVNPAPKISSIDPKSGQPGQTMTVGIDGEGFIGGVTIINFGPGIILLNQNVASFYTLTALIRIDTLATQGSHTITVTNLGPGGGSAQTTFSVGVNPAPSITGIQPSVVSRLQSGNVVIKGANFLKDVTTANFGTGILLDHFQIDSVNSATAAITVSPTCPLGFRDVIVRNPPPGGGYDTLRNVFSVQNPLPTLVSLKPDTVARLDSLIIVFTGSNFISGTTTVSSADTSVKVVSVAVTTDTTISAIVKILATAPTGPRGLTVMNPAPGGGSSAAKPLVVLNPVPTLISLNPQTGVRGTQLGVVLRGSGFIKGVSFPSFGAGIVIDSSRVDSARQMTAYLSIADTASTSARPVTVTNAAPGGGTSAALPFGVTIPKPPAPALVTPVNGARDLYVRQQFLWNKSPGATSYHLKIALTATFATPFVDDSTVTDTTRLVVGMLNDTLYYWKVQAVNSGGISNDTTWSFRTGGVYPQKFVVATTVPFAPHSTPGEYNTSDYRLFGLPGSLSKGLEMYFKGKMDEDWTAYRDNGEAANYLVKYSAGPAFTLGSGRAFWVIQRYDMTLNDSVPSLPLDTTGIVKIPLHPGFNIITNPLPKPVEWSYVQYLNGRDTVPLWGYYGAFQKQTTFAPYTGYLFDNSTLNLDSLIVPFSGLPTSVTIPTKAKADDGWTIDVALQSEFATEKAMWLGTSKLATEGMDKVDYHKPRSFAGAPTVYFRRPEWDSRSSLFASDIRPPVGELEKWTFEVSTKYRTPVELQFDGVQGVPEGLAVALLDLDHARSADVRTDQVYGFTPATDITRFTLVVGTPEAVKKETDQLLPKEFALGQNFPNPFNPTTTIPVSVPFASDVRLVVYNILGEEVRTVYAGTLNGGKYWFVWDGKNSRGQAVATGVYISRLTTAVGKAFTGKMILLK